MRYRARRILLADSDREFMAVTTRLLEKMGFHVIQAESGPQALSTLSTESRLNMVILDLELPEQVNRASNECICEYT